MIKKLLFGLIMLSFTGAQATNHKPKAKKIKTRSLSSLLKPCLLLWRIPPFAILATLGINTKNPVFPSDSFKTYYKKMLPKMIKRSSVICAVLACAASLLISESIDKDDILPAIIFLIGGAIVGAIGGTIAGIPTIPAYALKDKIANSDSDFEVDSDEPEQTQTPETA